MYFCSCKNEALVKASIRLFKKNSQNSEFFCIFANVATMKITFEDTELENLILLHQSKKYKKYIQDSKFLNALDRVFSNLQGAANTQELRLISYLHYEKLKRVNLSSVRVINGRVERLLFREIEDGIEITLIELDNTHYGQQ